MSAHPHVVTADAVFTWDHVPSRIGRGTILDVPPDSPLMAAIGADKLKPLYGAPPVTVPLAAEPAPEPEPAKAPRGTAKAAAAKVGGAS
jgi:hypothetical protein